MELSNRNSLNTIKTDLSLLLECLKFQMKCPDLQKQALLTIYSICEKKEDNVDLFRGMGGVTFVYSLSKSNIVHSDVKETALFTLGTLAETNVYCKNSLCRKETFSDLADWLVKGDTPLKQKRVAVYLLSVLVANNKSGQTFAQTTGCLDILLDLFRTSLPLSTGGTLKPSNITQTYQLWTSVSSALCGCVNNPQNEEGQRICVAAFPMVKTWLQQISLHRTEILQPICSFIAMTVASNSCAQESFSASGGLETLTLTLVRVASEAEKSLLSCQLSVTLTKTLSACITDNAPLSTGLAQYGVVPKLLSLLSSPNLDPQDRLSVVLTLGHCTEASEEHQTQLVQSGGLPTIITLLTESTSEELRKAATFILQTCKQAMSLGLPEPTKGDTGAVKPHSNMEGYWSSAREMLRRIELLEKRQVTENEQSSMDSPAPVEELGSPPQPTAIPSHPVSVQVSGGRGESLERGGMSAVWLRGGDRAMTSERWRDIEGQKEPKGRKEKWKNHQELAPDRIGGECRDALRGRRGGSEEQMRESIPVQPVLARRGQKTMRSERSQREELQHGDTALPLLGHVRRQIFKGNDKTHESALAGQVQEERRNGTHSNQKNQNEREHVASRQPNTLDAVEDGNDSNIDLQSLRRALKRRHSQEELKSGNSSLSTQGKVAKNTQCSQLEYYQVPEKMISSDTSSAAEAHTGVGVPGQAPDGGDVQCSACKGTGTLKSSHLISLEGAREPHTINSQMFKPPAAVRLRVPKEKEQTDDDDGLSLICSELLDAENSEMGKPSVALDTLSHIRCSGCVLRFDEVTSRTFTALQSSCSHSCDLHKVLQEATERFRALHCNPLLSTECQQGTAEQKDAQSERVSEAEPQRGREPWREICLTPIHKGKRGSLSEKDQRENHNGIRLIPLRRGAEMKRFTSHNRIERGAYLENGECAPDFQLKTHPGRKSSSNNKKCGSQRSSERMNKIMKNTDDEEERRKRKNFTHEEVRYLLNGVKTYGSSWNSILWSYPFQSGRTNIDLAKKYRRLTATSKST